MVKWKVAILFLITFLVAFITPVGVDLLVAYYSKNASPVVVRAEIDFSADTIYLGDKACPEKSQITTYSMPPLTSFDIAYVLGETDATVTVKEGYDEIAEISDNIITVLNYGALVLCVNNDGNITEYAFQTVDGVNVVTEKDFYALSTYYGYISENLVFQRDIHMANASLYIKRLYGYIFSFNLSGSIYGNGHSVIREEFVSDWYRPIFLINGVDVIVRDVRFIGTEIEDGAEINYDDLSYAGILLVFGQQSNGYNNATVENCIFENASRGAYLLNADVEFKGCLFTYMSDSCISIKTCNPRPSNLTLENCVLANAVVAGITNWCNTEADDENQCSITLKGFVDFYNWKLRDSAKIVPEYTDYSGLYNSYMQTMLKKNEIVRKLYYYDCEYYLNCAIVVICSAGGDMRNTPAILGLEQQDVQKMTLPVNSLVATMLTSADLYGYGNGDKISPVAKIEDNPYLFYELKNGR